MTDIDLDSVLTKDQKTGRRFPSANGKKIWVVWRFTKKLRAHVGLTDLRMVGGEWSDLGGYEYPADAAAAMASAITDLAAGVLAPPLAAIDAELQAREQDSTPASTWVIAIDKSTKLVVFAFTYDGTPSVMIRRYKNKGGWNFTDYAIIDVPSAVLVAQFIAAR